MPEAGLTLTYQLGPDDFIAGLRVLLAPGPVMRLWRPRLVKVLWVLCAVAGSLILWLVWRVAQSCCALPPRTKALLSGVTVLWGALTLVTARLSRDPDAGARWVRKWLAGRVTKRSPAGTRTLTLRQDVLELSGPSGTIARGWKELRKARRDSASLALDLGGLWVLVPLKSLAPGERESLLAEVSRRAPIEVLDDEGVENRASRT